MITKRQEEPGVLSKLLSTSLGVILLTEDSLRKGLKPLGLPKDATKYVIKQLDRRKDEMMNMIRDELHQVLSKVPFDRIAQDLLKTMDVEVTIRFVPRAKRHTQKPTHRWKSSAK